jgi:uncharacterized alpha-E superfamily protein
MSCITGARENANQVREQISSEMWETLNQLYHEVNTGFQTVSDHDPMRLLAGFRDGAYKFHGVTEATMNHGEGWYFIQVGKYMERATNISRLLDASLAESSGADDLDWINLLSSCSAFEAYRKVYTADLSERRVTEFLLLNSEFPYTVRYSADQLHAALESISAVSSARKTAQIDRLIGRLRASLAYSQIEEVIGRNLHAFLQSVLEECRSLHLTLHELFIDYPIESALEV